MLAYEYKQAQIRRKGFCFATDAKQAPISCYANKGCLMLAYLKKQASISAQLLASPFAPKGQTSISKR
jgi:hypothetical protein